MGARRRVNGADDEPTLVNRNAGNGRLPEELLSLILDVLPVCEVVKCRQLSRSFRQIIDGSYSLQYRIELLLAGMEDLGNSTLSFSEKRGLLQKYTSARDTLKPEHLLCTPMGLVDDRFWDVSDGLLTRITETGVKFTQLPSPIRGLSSRQWEFPMKPPMICGVDPSQDLLLVVYLDNQRFLIRPLSITSGERHPAATSRQFFATSPPFQNTGDMSAELAVVSNEVLFCAIHKGNRYYNELTLSAIDWRSGEARAHFYEKGFESFSALDENHIMSTSYNPADGAARLSVIDIREGIKSRIDFLLPKFRLRALPIGFSLASGPEFPTTTIPKSSSLPFRIATQDRLFVLAVMEEEETGMFIIPSWLLHQELAQIRKKPRPKRRKVVVPWKEWGPRCTAVINNGSNTSLYSDASFMSFGTRYVTVENEKVIIYDFNRFAVNHTTGPGHDQHSERGGENHKVTFDMFTRSVKTSVPWRKITTDLMVHDMCNVGIDHDRIFVSKDNDVAGHYIVSI